MATDNTFAEEMLKIVQNIATAATLPDADVAFCAQIQAAITQKLRADMNQASGIQGQGQPQMQAPPQGPPGAPMGGPMPGLTPSAPNMDEIRRMVGATGTAQ